MAVVFNEPTGGQNRSAMKTKKPSFFSKLIISTGVVKTATGAQIVMLVIAVIAIVGTVMLLQGAPKAPRVLSPADTMIR